MKILNFGSLNLDYTYDVDHFVQSGETQLAHDRTSSCGGKGLNQSIALARAGTQVFHAGMIGKDGKILTDLLEENGADAHLVDCHPDLPTGHAIIQKRKDGENCILLYGGCNQQIDPSTVGKALKEFSTGDLLVLQNETNVTAELMREAEKRGMKIAFTPAPMNENVFSCPLETVKIFLCNLIEARALTGIEQGSSEALMEAMQQKFPEACIVITLGKEGCIYADSQNILKVDAYPVNALDTTAAGDTFAGYFLSGICAGRNLDDALKEAAAASAICVSRAGAAASIPQRSEVLKFLKEKQEQ